MSVSRKAIPFNLWLNYFVWKFKGNLFNSTQLCVLFRGEILITIILKSSYAFLRWSPCVSTMIVSPRDLSIYIMFTIIVQITLQFNVNTHHMYISIWKIYQFLYLWIDNPISLNIYKRMMSFHFGQKLNSLWSILSTLLCWGPFHERFFHRK